MKKPTERQVGQADETSQKVDIPQDPVHAHSIEGRSQRGEDAGQGIGDGGGCRPVVAIQAALCMHVKSFCQYFLINGHIRVIKDHAIIFGPIDLEFFGVLRVVQPHIIHYHFVKEGFGNNLCALQQESRADDHGQDDDGVNVHAIGGSSQSLDAQASIYGQAHTGHHHESQ